MEVSIQLHTGGSSSKTKESLESIALSATTSPSREGKRRFEDSCRTDSFDDDSTDSLDRDDDRLNNLNSSSSSSNSSSSSIHRNESLNKMIDFLNDMEHSKNTTKRSARNQPHHQQHLHHHQHRGAPSYSLSFCRDDDELRVGAKILSTVTSMDSRMKRAKTFDNLVLLESSIILESIDVGAIYL